MKQPGFVHIRLIRARYGLAPLNASGPRPVGHSSHLKRWRAAWLVFTGQADALIWEGSRAERAIWGNINTNDETAQ